VLHVRRCSAPQVDADEAGRPLLLGRVIQDDDAELRPSSTGTTSQRRVHGTAAVPEAHPHARVLTGGTLSGR
jgi:hypothetical protein